MSLPSSPNKSPSRRVLGSLTPKAINTPSKQINNFDASEAMRAQSPLKQVQTLSPQLLMNKENPTGHGLGRKRSIYEVDGAENVEDVFGGRERTGRPVTAAALRKDAEAAAEAESHLMGSPTEPNTPSPGLEDDMPVSQETSASKESFSAFLDYEACATQKSEQALDSIPPPPVEKKSRAELLKLRLGFGIYKVKTNQIEKSVEEILSSSAEEDTSFNTSTSTAVTTSDTSNAHGIPSITLSPARRSSVTHVVANIDPSNDFPKLMGGPVLLPTAYSSRMIYSNNMPSSPPTVPHVTSASPERLMSPIRTSTTYRTPISTRVRTEEEYDDEDVDMEESVQERLQRLQEQRFEQGDLTSSVVKGHVATGLLELMSGKR